MEKNAVKNNFPNDSRFFKKKGFYEFLKFEEMSWKSFAEIENFRFKDGIQAGKVFSEWTISRLGSQMFEDGIQLNEIQKFSHSRWKNFFINHTYEI